MFEVTIIGDDNKIVIGKLDKQASAAEYFACCIYLLVDLLNGGQEINKLPGFNKNSIKTEFAPQTALAMLISQLHDHPAFNPEKVFNSNNPNFAVFQEITKLLQLQTTDTSSHILLMDLLKNMKVPGIKSITFKNNLSKNAEILYKCNFPDSLIPEEFLCPISNLIMTTPCLDTSAPNYIMEQSTLTKALENNGKHPYTNIVMNPANLRFDSLLEQKISNFVQKVLAIFKCFHDSYNQKYKEYEASLKNNELSAADFEIQLMKASLLSSTKTGFFQSNTNLNPLHLYQAAIENYKNKNYKNSLALLGEAIQHFGQKNGQFSEEVCKCYSTMISCFRELKDYNSAIKTAEITITLFFGQALDLSNVIKKLTECLTLKQTSFNEISAEAANYYKAKNHAFALHLWLIALESTTQNSNPAEQATLHSNLASCYRELGQFHDAVKHCQVALEIRKSQLSHEAGLIAKTEEKLAELLSILNDKASLRPNP